VRIRRCWLLWLEPRETVHFALDSLLGGGDGLRREQRWLALAPHLGREIEVDAAQRERLGQLSAGDWIEADADDAVLQSLLDLGLVVSDGPAQAANRERDEALRAGHWHPLAALQHVFGRWSGVDVEQALEQIGTRRLDELVERLGAPPSHRHRPARAGEALPLPRVGPKALATLLAGRATCRNWDSERSLPLDRLASVLQQSFAAQAAQSVGERITLLKKVVPSGGGLHPTEAYLLLRRVDGLPDGFYHYDSLEHALRPLPAPAEADREALALRLLAGQRWFAGAQVLLFHVCRFARSFWKYRRHAKAYRAVTLDVGHLSQAIYLAATEQGLGAFVTAAINEVEIEQALGLDPLAESPLAVSGIGWRGSERRETEFDPLHAVWPSRG
jgi:putative peptide maturation dehydrogenase